MTELPDIIFPVKSGEHNEELRYALRSLSNIPHGQVWIAGYKPKWVQDVGYIPLKQIQNKYQNALTNLLEACKRTNVSEEFILWNDDMFLLAARGHIPVFHRGTVSNYIRKFQGPGRGSIYVRGLAHTADLLRRLGHLEPLNYELHIPMPLAKSHVLKAYKLAQELKISSRMPLQIRTLVGNVYKMGGHRVNDVKVMKPSDLWVPGSMPIVSTADAVWKANHAVVHHVKNLFPLQSPYERPTL